jgi:prepilin-type N-terminal cleavage/methylation domain-containing protein
MRHPDLSKRRSGLTLIEVMVALGVLVILVGGIFMVVQTALKTVLLIDSRASREDEITNLTDILRSNFRNLPTRSQLTAGPVRKDGTNEYLFVVRNAPGFMTWLSAPEADDQIVLLSLRQDSKMGRWRICMKRFAPPKGFPENEANPKVMLNAASAIPWLELVADFDRIAVRFFDGQTQAWTEEWKHPEIRPLLIEFTMIYEHTKDARSSAAVFWIPPVKGGTT